MTIVHILKKMLCFLGTEGFSNTVFTTMNDLLVSFFEGA